MTTRERNSIEAGLEGLPVIDVPPERREAIRSACLSQLARRRRQTEARREAARRWRGRLEMAVAAGMTALYLAGTVERVLEILS